jgi:Fe-S-cluster containining protein
MFIPIKPDEKRTIQRIPRSLLFPVPGMPKGHVLLGYNDQGHCPMLVDNQCSIYEDRPRTCRDYDCRVFAATGISVDRQNQPEIADRVKRWVFDYESEEGREEHGIVKRATAFLEESRDLFPAGSLPSYPVQLAALAVSVYRIFSEVTAEPHHDESALSDTAIAHAILAALNDSDAASGPQGVRSQ